MKEENKLEQEHTEARLGYSTMMRLVWTLTSRNKPIEAVNQQVQIHNTHMRKASRLERVYEIISSRNSRFYGSQKALVHCTIWRKRHTHRSYAGKVCAEPDICKHGTCAATRLGLAGTYSNPPPIRIASTQPNKQLPLKIWPYENTKSHTINIQRHLF